MADSDGESVAVSATEDDRRLGSALEELPSALGLHPDPQGLAHAVSVPPRSRALARQASPACHSLPWMVAFDSMKLTLELGQEKDGRWIAEVPELPGVAASADTRKEAIQSVCSMLAHALETEAPSTSAAETWRGRTVVTREESARMECPFTPEPEWKAEWE